MSTMLATMNAATPTTGGLSLHQYAQWREWAMGETRRRSERDLLDDIVDPEAERHMYIPMKQAAIVPSFSPAAAATDLGSPELVARVVAFLQNIHNNHAIRQLQLAEGLQPMPLGGDDHAACAAAARMPLHELSDNVDTPDVAAMTELGLTPSLIAEQKEIWNRAKQERQAAANAPVIPEWLHHAARQEGRRIRVVTLDNSVDTRTVTCIGCKKKMLAAAHVEIVYCPECGCTFSPNDFTLPSGE